MTERPLPAPPVELARITELVGAEGTLRLVEAVGGTRIYIPKGRGVDAVLASQVGSDIALSLAAGMGGDHLDVPLARAWRIRVYDAQGLTHGAIARRLGMTKNGVARSLREKGGSAPRAAAPESQLDLFSRPAGVRTPT